MHFWTLPNIETWLTERVGGVTVSDVGSNLHLHLLPEIDVFKTVPFGAPLATRVVTSLDQLR